VTGRPKVIGITGTIASGKSLVGKILTEQGFPVIDTDVIVHDLFAHSASLKQAICGRFGNGVLTSDGSGIDRTKLGAVIFADAAARKDLEAIVHPATIEECEQQVLQAGEKSAVVFVLVPLLFEAKQEHRYDEIWAVHTDLSVLRERLRARNQFTDQEIDARLSAQLSQSEKISRAHRTIDNSGTIDSTTGQVMELITALRRTS
jgi:dephospho-CoA kinase